MSDMTPAKPIIFSDEMVRAIRDGRKTMTRRVAKLTDAGHVKEPRGHRRWHPADPDAWLACPYGQPGDLLWVRETCRAHELTDAEAESDLYGVEDRVGDEAPPYGLDGVVYRADNKFREIENSQEAAERWGALRAHNNGRSGWVPSIHMPRWASRITLRITSVRVERLHEITEVDASAEGVTVEPTPAPYRDACRELVLPVPRTARGAFASLWDRLHGPGSWEANPWLWVIGFERVTP